MTPEQLRNLVKEVCKKDITTEQATLFLKIELMTDDLTSYINAAKREFVRKHFINFEL